MDLTDFQDDRELSAGDGTIIKYLMDKLNYNQVLEDEVGVYGLHTPSSVVTGKKYVWQGYVSCHVKAVYAADNTDKNLIMYIKDRNSFYRFDPRKIIEDEASTYINKKGDAKMYNFPFDWGTKTNELR